MKRKKKGMACTACNEHIGSMAALPPLENMYEIEHLSPAGKYLEAATAPICHHVVRQFADSAVGIGERKKTS